MRQAEPRDNRMAIRTVAAVAACGAIFLQTQIARGQSITTEAALSTGYSTDDVTVGATQVRAFGELKKGVHFFGEAAWAASSDTDNDVFGTAYPYRNRVQIIEAYADRTFRPKRAILGIRGGRFRTPFGIYDASDQAYVGFLRPPLVRYAEYTSLSNNFLEHGAGIVVGVPFLTFQTVLGAPADVGETARGSGLDTVLRVQGFHGSFIAGFSYLRNHSHETPADPRFRASATGIDFRWMQSGIQVRGEWIGGRPADDATNNGWYVDALIHRAGMGPVMAIARIERLAVTDEGEEEQQGRQTIGARIRLLEALSLNVNVVHRSGEFATEYGHTAFDLGFTWNLRRH